MVAIQITQKDLDNLKNEIKLDINEDNTNRRHEDRKIVNNVVWKVDELEIKSAVNDNILKTMTTSIDKLEKVVTEWFREMNWKLELFNDKFSSKEDHKVNWIKINSIEKALDSINLKIAWVSGWFAVVLFLIEKFIK